MITIILFIVVCVFCLIVGLMVGYFLGAIKRAKKTKPTNNTKAHFEPGGFYTD